MHIVAAGQTDVGRRREHNEDAYLIDPRLALYIVCDGVGGHAAGEVASHKTVSVVQEVIHRHRAILDAHLTSPSDPQLNAVMHLVEEAVQEACSCLYTIGEREPSKKGMGTTIAMLLALQKTVIVGKGNAGSDELRWRQSRTHRQQGVIFVIVVQIVVETV